MDELILINIEGGFAVCRVVTPLTTEEAKTLGASLVRATQPALPPAEEEAEEPVPE